MAGEAHDTARPQLRARLSELLADRRSTITAERARLEQTAEANRAERAAVVAERERILAEHDDAPPASSVVRRDRATAKGAPLWRLVDFVGTLTDADRAGLEASLAAAGLLDAWIAPAGVVPDDALDLFLTGLAPSDSRQRRDAGGTLADLLVADIPDGAGVSPEQLRAVLAAVPLGAVGCQLSVDGGFVLGPLRGRSLKQSAEFIGSTARASRRARRAAELATAIAGLDHAAAELGTQRDSLDEMLASYDEAGRAIPSTAALDAAVGELDRATTTVELRTTFRGRREVEAAAASSARAAAHDALRAEAARRRVPTDPEQLDALDGALTGLERAAGDYATAASSALQSVKAVALAEGHSAARDAELVVAGRAVVERDSAHHGLRAQLATLEDTIGASATEVLADLDRVDADLRLAEAAQETARERQHLGRTAAERADVLLEQATGQRESADVDRRAALDRLAPLRRPELRGVLQLDDDESPAQFADRLEAATRGTAIGDDRRQAAKTAVRNAFKELETQLGPSYHPALDDDDDIDLAMVTDDEGRSGLAAFAGRITARRDTQRLLLSDQERRVLEDTLVDTLCRQLHQRLRDAEEQVGRMNTALAGRLTTSGKGIQLSWTSSDELSDDQRQIVKLLERDPAYLGPDRELLRESLASEIRVARAQDPTAGYQAVLGRVLDYRTWRSFGVVLRERDGSSRRLTRKLFNQHSGGERATILHLPLFAAAAAHFAAARPGCPRLIALDEAFAGIDLSTTRQLLALSVEFDLDLFLTGHDFWGTVAEVPALAIVQLSHDRDSHTVASLAMRWDGTTLHDER